MNVLSIFVLFERIQEKKIKSNNKQNIFIFSFILIILLFYYCTINNKKE